LGGLGPGELPLWRRTRATPALLGLVVLLCATLTLLPTFTPCDQLADALAAMTAENKDELARSFAKAARQAEQTNPELARDYLQAAKAVEIDDPEKLKEVLRKLRRRGFRLVEVVGAEVLAAAGGVGGGADAAGVKSPPKVGPNGTRRRVSPPKGGRGLVRVFDPEYAKILAGRKPPPKAGAGPDGAGDFVHLDEAWQRARQGAQASLAAGKVPPEYRQIVRDFFAGG